MRWEEEKKTAEKEEEVKEEKEEEVERKEEEGKEERELLSVYSVPGTWINALLILSYLIFLKNHEAGMSIPPFHEVGN